jgi:hypothetical protein
MSFVTLFVLMVILFLVVACSPSTSLSPTVEPTAIPSNTPVPPTATPTITETPTPTFTITPDRPATKAAASTTAVAGLTTTAQPMADTIQKLYEDGYLASTEGTFYKLEDFDYAWAQLNYYTWLPTDYSPKEFVVSADAQWWSDSDNANWYTSGCGFVFRAVDEDNHYLVYLAPAGRVVAVRVVHGKGYLVGVSNDIPFSLDSDNAHIMMIVQGVKITFFVNGQKVSHASDNLLQSATFEKGYLAYTVFSGTNKGFGTRCKMTNVGLWYIN